MASEREKAKGAVVKSDDEDAELEAALASAAKHQLDLKKEDNRHREEMNKMSLGFIGRAFGGEKSAPMFIAAIAAGLAFLAILYTLHQGSSAAPEMADYWSTQTERLIALMIAALTFIFGRGSAK